MAGISAGRDSEDEGDEDGGIAKWARDLLRAADSALRAIVGLDDEEE